MIKKENRLSGSRQVGKVLQKGFSVKTPNLSCRILSGKPTESVRLTVVVSKKVASHAVDRNLIKRRVREAFDSHLAGKTGSSVVVFPKASAKDADFQCLKDEAVKCLENQRSFS
ncbi:MAG: ribonuclease P protein component [Candidatus Omnitrophota bacterium]|jgi:ribonuclease P protein component